MKILPFNNRLLIEEIVAEKHSKDVIATLDFAKERKELPKFMKVKILELAPNISSDFYYLKDKEAYIETGFLEEIVIDNKMHRFCPINYVVCVNVGANEKEVIRNLVADTKNALKTENILT